MIQPVSICAHFFTTPHNSAVTPERFFAYPVHETRIPLPAYHRGQKKCPQGKKLEFLGGTLLYPVHETRIPIPPTHLRGQKTCSQGIKQASIGRGKERAAALGRLLFSCPCLLPPRGKNRSLKVSRPRTSRLCRHARTRKGNKSA